MPAVLVEQHPEADELPPRGQQGTRPERPARSATPQLHVKMNRMSRPRTRTTGCSTRRSGPTASRSRWRSRCPTSVPVRKPAGSQIRTSWVGVVHRARPLLGDARDSGMHALDARGAGGLVCHMVEADASVIARRFEQLRLLGDVDVAMREVVVQHHHRADGRSGGLERGDQRLEPATSALRGLRRRTLIDLAQTEMSELDRQVRRAFSWAPPPPPPWYERERQAPPQLGTGAGCRWVDAPSCGLVRCAL